MKLWILFFSCFVSIVSFGKNPFPTERPQMSAVLTEVDFMGQPIPFAPKYTLTLNMREGIATHPTSFSLCPYSELAKQQQSYCQLFWVFKEKEPLRCEAVRYVASLSPTLNSENEELTPTAIVVDEMQPGRNCEEALLNNTTSPTWEVRTYVGDEIQKTFYGEPEISP